MLGRKTEFIANELSVGGASFPASSQSSSVSVFPHPSIHPPSLSISLPSAMIVRPIRGSIVTKDVRSSLYGRKFLDRLRADWEIMEFFCCILLGMGFKVKLFRASWKCFRATGHTFREPINTSIITLTRRGG